MPKVLITGGAGFIGSHLCDELVAHGYDVCVLDNLDPQVHGPSPRIPAYLNRVEMVIGDVRDKERVTEALIGIDAVVHLAAKVGVGQSACEPDEYVGCNTWGTSILLERMTEVRPKKLIVASSMSVYGEGERDYSWGNPVPLSTTEIAESDLQSIYALTKYDQERLCLLWGQAYKVPTIALRFFNVYGTRQSLSNPYTGVMAIFASRLLNGKPPIIFEDGQQSRDFVHVSDVVRGIRLALESDVGDEVINIGSGQSHTILEVAERLNTTLGTDILPEITGQHRVGDIRHCFADISKAKRLLGYKPEKSIEDGMAEYVEWLRTQTAVDKLDEHVDELKQRGLLG